MIEQPIIETSRLKMRPLKASDSSLIEKNASIREIADTMISLPHPYPAGEAERYIARQQTEHESGLSVAFIIEHKDDGCFCGLAEIRAIDREHSQAELSFWMVVDVWGRGYMSEAVHELVQYAINNIGINRLYAYHMLRNPASGHVLKKNGFRQEGLLRQRVRKWGQYEDVALWAILREDILDN